MLERANSIIVANLIISLINGYFVCVCVVVVVVVEISNALDMPLHE